MISADKNAGCVINTLRVASSISSLRQAHTHATHSPMMERTLRVVLKQMKPPPHTHHLSPLAIPIACVRCKFYIKMYKNNQDLLHHTGRFPRGPGAPPARAQQKGLRRFILPRN